MHKFANKEYNGQGVLSEKRGKAISKERKK